MKEYENTDKETVDFLFEMIDFDKFKAKMCAQKRSIVSDAKLENQGGIAELSNEPIDLSIELKKW